MNKSIVRFWLFSMMVLTSCTMTKERNDNQVINGYDENVFETNSPQSSFVDEIEVIPLRSDSQVVALTNPEKIIYSDSCYYVLDNNMLLRYDAHGNYGGHIGEQGHGNGEYISLATFVVRNDTIILIDSFKNSLLAYSLKGNFLYEKKAPDGVLVNVRDAVYENDVTLFLSNYIYNDQNNIYTRWNIETDEVLTVASIKVCTDGTKEAVGIHSFCFYGNNIRYVMPFSNIISSTDSDALQLQTTNKVLRDEELQKIRDYSIMTYANHSDCFPGFCNIFETKNYIILTFFNLEYTVIDKRNKECYRYSYLTDDECAEFPLFNIISSEDNVLLGIANVEENAVLKEKLKNYIDDNENSTDYIIRYHVK